MPNARIVRAHLVFHGSVQGVGFRAFVQAEAGKRSLVGWVRNTHEGLVEAEVEGESDAVHGFLDVTHQGPLLASVDRCDVQWIPVVGTEQSYDIVR